MSRSDDESTVHWYYRGGGKDQGPVLLSRLRQMAHRGTLTSNDLVRKGKTGDWVPAGSFVEIDSRAASTVGPLKTEAVDSRSAVPASNRIKELTTSAIETVSDLLSDLIRAVVDRWALIRAAGMYLALAAVAVCLIRVTAGSKLFDWSRPADPYMACRSLWNELRDIRTGKGDDKRWREFAERGRNELAPITLRLEREATSSNRYAQLLLWASRDCLPKMFEDARVEPSLAELRLAEYLENVDRLRVGQPVYGGNLKAPRNASVQTVSSVDRLVGWFRSDPTTAIMGVLLTAVNMFAVFWFLKGVVIRALADSKPRC
jgi:hypothetical protein